MKKNTVILAIDQATTSGYCIYKNGRIYKSGIWKFNKANHEKRVSEFYNTLVNIIQKEHVTQIVAENVPFENSKNNNSIISLGEMRGVIELVNAQFGFSAVEFIDPTTHKFLTTGSTFANKIQTMQAIQEKGYNPKDDNESDSISILLCYCYYQNIRVNHPDN